ncbi:MAG: hypothetical protein ACK4FF_10695 [Limnobacter sp.]|uniref:hypothetical protein n=1 Tax=Limnobacter sp. TaxID=2003368 RepID=UPI00391A49DD
MADYSEDSSAPQTVYDLSAGAIDHAAVLQEMTERYHALLAQLEIIATSGVADRPNSAGATTSTDHSAKSRPNQIKGALAELDALHVENQRLKLELVRTKSLLTDVVQRVADLAHPAKGQAHGSH